MNQPDGGNKLSLAQSVTMACLLEVTAPKPGNVHRSADFEDVTYVDFVTSSVAIGPVIANSCRAGVGASVFQAIQATRRVTRSNTNLGTVLLLAPLAAVASNQPVKPGIRHVLAHLTEEDAVHTYNAIRLANPGGLGRVEQMDVTNGPPADLRQAMGAAADRDLVARQYVNDFATVLDEVLPWLVQQVADGWSLTDAIIHTQLRLLSSYPDSLIQRKCGLEVARQASQRAERVLAAGSPGDANYLQQLADLDFWMRSDQHRRNPGTTADLIAAGLFAGLREGVLEPSY